MINIFTSFPLVLSLRHMGRVLQVWMPELRVGQLHWERLVATLWGMQASKQSPTLPS